MNSTKLVWLSDETPTPTTPQPRKRKVTQLPRWVANVSVESQYTMVESLLTQGSETREQCNILQQLRIKRHSYKYQDEKKGIYDQEKFVQLKDILAALKDSRLKCYYCGEPVNLLYDNVREREQWTLDRINNAYGHNRDNIVVSCLECNLHRRSMYHGRFKQSCDIVKHQIVKKVDSETK